MANNWIQRELGDAIRILYNLNIGLGNGYIGDGGPHDRALHRIRKQVEKAMDAIESKKIYPLLRKLER